MNSDERKDFVPRVERARHRIISKALCGAQESTLIALGRDVSAGEYQAVRKIVGISGVIFATPENREHSGQTSQTDGCRFPAEYRWELPQTLPSTLWLHFPVSQLSFRMLVAAATSGIRSVIFPAPGGWRRRLLVILIMERLMGRAGGLIRRALSWMIVRMRASHLGTDGVSSSRKKYHHSTLERQIRRALTHPNVPLLPREAFVPHQVLIANSSLAWGGAERQIINTLQGLHQLTAHTPSLLVEHLHTRPDDDFYLRQLVGTGVLVKTLQTSTDIDLLEDGEFSDKLAAVLQGLPSALAQDVWDYAVEIARTRPAVVHSWQDATNIKCGLAAAIIGIPRIILSGRNMAPWRFAYHQPYMKPGYRALVDQQAVTLLNNSRAGGRDYEEWLSVERGAIQVVANGMREQDLLTPSRRVVEELRKRLGVPAGNRVVGSVFRFYPETDPLLWLATAERIARVRDDVSFIVAGTGTMHESFLREAHSRGIAHRVFAEGPERDVAALLSAMDVFLLTSHLEGTPNAIIEAQWLGVPVVATEAGGTEDAFENGLSGWLVKDRNPDDLANRVLAVLENPDIAASAARAAKQFARSRFSLHRMIEETTALYELQDQHEPV